MKNSRNTRDSSNKGQQDSFMFPERDDDTYFELPPEEDMDEKHRKFLEED